MWNAFGPYKAVTNSFLIHKIPTKPGQSGSPVLKREGKEEFIIGVHIGSDPECKRNYAVRLTSYKRKMINEWVGEATGILDISKIHLLSWLGVRS